MSVFKVDVGLPLEQQAHYLPLPPPLSWVMMRGTMRPFKSMLSMSIPFIETPHNIDINHYQA